MRIDYLPSRRATLSLPLLAPLVAACSPLGVMNTLSPKDANSYRRAEDVVYGPDPRQRFDIYAPEDAVENPKLLVFIYGGSWRDGSKANYAFVGRAFAAAGYLVAIPDYRIVPDVRYPDFVIDCGRAAATFQARAEDYGSRHSQVYLVGHSAGAYNAVMLALADELAAAGGLARSTIAAVAALSGPYDFLPLRVRATEQAFAGVENLQATQPVNRVQSGAPPMLLANGSDDDVVVPKNMYRLQELLKAEGVPVVIREYEGLGHAATLLSLARLFRWRADVLDDVTDFFAGIDEQTIKSAARPQRA
jgi:acetyl esterase/lipase